MPRTLGTPVSSAPAPSAPVTSPPATRVARPGWRDPRLWIGVALVAACVVAGARLFAAADDTVEAWTLAAPATAGTTIDESDLVAIRVRFADAGGLDGYFRVTDELPAELELVRDVGQGELLPRSALGSVEESGLLQIPLSIDPGQVPPSVEPGSVVDVYIQPSPRGRADPVLEGVSVVSDVSPTESFSATGMQQVTVSAPQGTAQDYFAALGSVDAPTITIVRRG